MLHYCSAFFTLMTCSGQKDHRLGVHVVVGKFTVVCISLHVQIGKITNFSKEPVVSLFGHFSPEEARKEIPYFIRS
jgi:hypothetical protein